MRNHAIVESRDGGRSVRPATTLAQVEPGDVGLTSSTWWAPPVEERIADGCRAVPLTVIVFLLIDVVTKVVGATHGPEGLGFWGLLAAAQSLVVAAAAAAMMRRRPRIAVVLTAIVVALVFTAGPGGTEIFLLLVMGVSVAAWGSRWQVGLVMLAQLGYAVAFGLLLEREFPGQGWAGGLVTAGAAAVGLAVGALARRLLRTRDRTRQRVRQLEQEQHEIRARERTRLADELQLLVTDGLASIDAELDAIARRPDDPGRNRLALTQVDLHSRALMRQLRILVEVLRRHPDDPDGGLVVRGFRFRAVDLLTARHVRLAASAVFGLLAVRAGAGGLGSLPSAEVLVEVIGLVACAVAGWRPKAGACCAASALVAFILLGSTGYGAAISTTLLCLVGAFRLGPRRIWLLIVGAAAYAGAVVLTHSPNLARQLVLDSYLGFLALTLGLASRHFVSAREQSLGRLEDLAAERNRVQSQERTAVARELHDMVAHSLSITTMAVLATSMTEDPDRLADTVDRVRHSISATHLELGALLHAMHAPDPDRCVSAALVSPLAVAQGFAEQLAQHDYLPVLNVDPNASSLDQTTARTLARIMQEATTNILRYAPTGSSCQLTLGVNDTAAQLTIISQLSPSGRRSDLSLGWGLLGIRERVELTHGTFAAGPDHNRWRVEVSLPTAAGAHREPVQVT